MTNLLHPLEDAAMSTEEVHTIDTPYCKDKKHDCHFDVAYHTQVQFPTYTNEQIAQALAFFGVEPVQVTL
jgi:hypothetical protein